MEKNSVQGSVLSLNWGKPTTSSFVSRHLEDHRQLQSRQSIYKPRSEGRWRKRSRPSLHNIVKLFWREWGKQRSTSACARGREFSPTLPELKTEVLTTQQQMLHAVGPVVPTALIPWVHDCQLSEFHGCHYSHCALLGPETMQRVFMNTSVSNTRATSTFMFEMSKVKTGSGYK